MCVEDVFFLCIFGIFDRLFLLFLIFHLLLQFIYFLMPSIYSIYIFKYDTQMLCIEALCQVYVPTYLYTLFKHSMI